MSLCIVLRTVYFVRARGIDGGRLGFLLQQQVRGSKLLDFRRTSLYANLRFAIRADEK